MKTLLSLTSRTFSMNRVRVFFKEIGNIDSPEGVRIDTHQKVISCTRDALDKLGDLCSSTAKVLGFAFLVSAGVDNALAQNSPTSGDTISITPVPQTPADGVKLKTALSNGVAGGTIESSNSDKSALDKMGMTIVKIDGIEYTIKTIAGMKDDKQMKLLENASEEDQNKVADYIIALGNAAIAEGERLDAQIQETRAEGERLDAQIQETRAENTIKSQKLQDAIDEGVQLDKKKLILLRSLVELRKPISSDYRPLIEKYAINPPPDENAVYILEHAQFA